MGGKSDDAATLADKARPRAHYPHARRAGDFVFVSGISARRADDSVAGAETRDGRRVLDIRAQTAAVIENIRDILGSFGAGLGDLVEAQCFLVDMADYAGFNETWNRYFGPGTAAPAGPARTTVAVKSLPHPDLAVEIRAVAFKPA
ncbi:MAG: RidA family protein [Rhodospirillales bacterium]|nr:RidA family protein [Rhodospirillales bacterium]